MSVCYAQGIKVNPDIFIRHTSLSKPSSATNQRTRTKVAIDRLSNEKLKKSFALFILKWFPLVLEEADLALSVAGMLSFLSTSSLMI